MTAKITVYFFFALFFCLQVRVNTLPVPGAIAPTSYTPDQMPHTLQARSVHPSGANFGGTVLVTIPEDEVVNDFRVTVDGPSDVTPTESDVVETKKNPIGFMRSMAEKFRESFKWVKSTKGWKWVQQQGTRINEALKRAWSWFTGLFQRKPKDPALGPWDEGMKKVGPPPPPEKSDIPSILITPPNPEEAAGNGKGGCGGALCGPPPPEEKQKPVVDGRYVNPIHKLGGGDMAINNVPAPRTPQQIDHDIQVDAIKWTEKNEERKYADAWKDWHDNAPAIQDIWYDYRFPHGKRPTDFFKPKNFYRGDETWFEKTFLDWGQYTIKAEQANEGLARALGWPPRQLYTTTWDILRYQMVN